MREAIKKRKTKETDIVLELSLERKFTEIETGIGFFDHMLTAFSVHGGFGLKLKVQGDLEVDGHHTVEDVGIVLGQAFAEVLGDKGAIKRYGNASIPMDESLAVCVLDVSGRPFLRFDCVFIEEMVGQFNVCLVQEFFRAFVFNAGITMHIKGEGENAHHKIEAVFKAAAYALKEAVQAQDKGVLSTKGSLA